MTEALHLVMTVNGQACAVDVHPFARLLDVLRDDLRLTGTKEGCGEGECGACTVLLNGLVVNSCLVPAAQAQGAEVVTVEGLAEGGNLSAVQTAFLKFNAAQCGFCSPGMMLSATDLLRRNAHPSEDDIREGLAGNLCRCTGYSKILDAVTEASK